MRGVSIAVVAAVAATLAAGCGSDERLPALKPTPVTDPAARFAVRVHADLTNGLFARAWRSLHPAQQRILDAPALARCWKLSGESKLRRRSVFEARDVTDTRWLVPGGPAKLQRSKAVRVQIRDASSHDVVQTFVQHVFLVGDRYRWIVSEQILRAFRRAGCGSS